MTIDQLRGLMAVVEKGSFQAASEGLYRSRSAISISIKNLEDDLGFSIFSRAHSGPVLTIQGKAFYEKARQSLEAIDKLEDFAKYLQTGAEAEITMVVDSLCPLAGVMTILHLFQTSHPSLKIKLSIENNKHIPELLLNQKTDFALTYLTQSDPLLESLKWVTIELIPVATPAFPLSHATVELGIEELQPYVMVLVNQTLEDYVAAYQQQLTTWIVNDLYAQKQILISALGWGIMPTHFIQNELAIGSLVPLKLKNFQKPSFDISLIRKADEPMGPIAQEIWTTFQ
ncbi:MAG: LysR family transcriptional regulator [SAR324 cluster bacterium]|nr:LysR family transcriptional regulator [SAR324 cluster bacterium]